MMHSVWFNLNCNNTTYHVIHFWAFLSILGQNPPKQYPPGQNPPDKIPEVKTPPGKPPEQNPHRQNPPDKTPR